jgi:hypothetical protein
MSRAPLRILAPLAVVALALALRLGGGPGAAYLHGIGGVSDEPAYVGEGLYLSATLSGGVGDEHFFPYAPPVHQLLLALAPTLSPILLEPTGIAPEAAVPALRSPGGRPYTIAYLPAGSAPQALLPSLELLSRADITGFARQGWLAETRERLARGEAAVLSVLTPNTPVDRSLPIAFAVDPLLVPGSGGLEIIDRATGSRVATLESGRVRSVAVAIGADDPLSIAIATIDEASVLRVWRMTDQAISPWGAGLLSVHDEHLVEAASVAPGPSGDLLLVSARGDRGWELRTYETTSSISLVGRFATDGPLRLSHIPTARETIALAQDGTALRVSGGPIAGARFVIALVGALGALLAWLLGRRLGGRRLALGAGLLFAVDPLGVAMGRVAYQDATLATMTIGAATALVFALSPLTRRRGRWFALLGLFGGLAAATKLFALPVAFIGPFLAACSLPRPARLALGSLGTLLGVALLVAGAGGGSTSSIVAGAIALGLGIALACARGEPLGMRPLLLALLGVAVGYSVPWLLRDAILVASGHFEPFASIVEMHLSALDNASRAASAYISTWWLWPSGITTTGVRAVETGSVIWAPGIALAAGIAAAAGARRPTSRALSLLLLLLWAAWAIPVRYQMPYYALPACIAAVALVVTTARERPRDGRLAIPLALLAPLAGALAYASRAEVALIALPLAGVGAIVGDRLLRGRSVAPLLAVAAWPLASLLSLGIGVAHGAALAPLAGLAASLAARGGWRLAPWGAALAGGSLLLQTVVELVGFRLPGGIGGDWSLGEGHQVNPIGIALVLLVVGSIAIRARRSAPAR